MQDRYAGDVGDFGKFSLLKNIFKEKSYRLGVVWYLFPNESHNMDGRHREYLTKTDYLRCDPELCSRLKNVDGCHQSVSMLESLELLPLNTVYYSDKLDFHLKYPTQSDKDKLKRKELRVQWLESAVAKTSACNAIFLDPDNGLEIDSCPNNNQIKSGKYAYYYEVKAQFKDKDACVIYHHLNRHKMHGKHREQIQSRVDKLREHINPTGKIFALRFTPYSPRAYFIITVKSEEKRMRESLGNFLESSCGRFCDSYCEG